MSLCASTKREIFALNPPADQQMLFLCLGLWGGGGGSRDFYVYAWNHCFCSGFRHTHWGGFCSCVWNHYKSSGFKHIGDEDKQAEEKEEAIQDKKA